MKYKEIKVNLPKEIAEDFENFLGEINVLGHYEILFDPTLKKQEIIISDYTNIRIYLQEDNLNDEIRILIFLHAKAPGDNFIETRVIETTEYMTSYLEYYKPFAAGEKIWVIPIWDKEKTDLKASNMLPLFINPGLAFGTGHHETTKLMIARMETLIQKGDRILDCGCGSGILSIAAGRLGATEIVAFDIDPNAVDSSKYNWEQNDFDDKTTITLHESSFDLPILKNEEFSLAVINITYAIISANIHNIAQLNTKHYLFSGIIQEKKEELLDLLEKMVGGELVFQEQMNDWVILEWKK